MSLKSMLIENLRDYSYGLYSKELLKFSDQEQKEFLKIREGLRDNMISETRKGNNVIVFSCNKDEQKFLKLLTMWLDHHDIYWSLDDENLNGDKELTVIISD